jgi:hypothetical protein
MRKYECPLCHKPLTKSDFERVVKLHEATQQHVHDLEESIRTLKANSAKKVEQAKKEGERKGIQKAGRMMSGLKTENEKLRDRIRQLQKGTTPQTEGLEFEDILATRLKREFPDDDIQHKGKGGDILHIVKFEKKTAGVIIYECKREGRIKPDHVQQTFRAKQSREADFAVLVTIGKQKGFSGLAQMNGVLVVAPLGAIPLAALLRGHLIEIMRAKITKEKRKIIAQQLLKYITSPQFKNPIEEVIKTASELQGMVKDEYNDHIRVWKKRLIHYNTIEWNTSHIHDNLRLVLHGKEPKSIGRPKVAPLQLTASTR